VVTRRGDEAGKARLGCLFFLLVAVALGYYGFQYLEVRYRFYRMQDEVRNNATFAPTLSDEVIRRRLVARADTLGIPIGRRDWVIRRTREPREIFIYGAYDDSVVIELPGYTKVFRFRFEPQARAPL
jgi:hypothetical protein